VTVLDDRFEEMRDGNWKQIALRDASAGLLVAMMAIPMAMGFAIASGLRPEHGIMAGALAGLVGALFGGSKYNVYGPVAALIPVIAGIMTKYRTPEDAFAGHGFIVAICIASGVILMLVALAGWGRIGNLVPHSVVVGFSVGIAITIAQTQIGEILGLKVASTATFLEKLAIIGENIGKTNLAAIAIGIGTFIVTRTLLSVSIFIPAPLLALGASTVLGSTVFAGSNLTLIKTNYGEIPTDFLTLAPPRLPSWESSVIFDLAFYAAAFAFVCGFESLLAARLADRLADNKRTPYNPNKEFWGQGLIQAFIPMMNGMPLSGALARTATNIKVGAVTPLAGIMKCVFKLGMVFFLADYLEMVPMACIAGILLWVAVNMVKPKEIVQVWHQNRFHAFLMVYTGVMVVLTSFLTAVLSAMVIFLVLQKRFDTPGVALTH
jgi:MFS superfamily sulfate permease-like transporter